MTQRTKPRILCVDVDPAITASLSLRLGQIAHHLRNPLGAVRNAVFYLKGELQDAQPDVNEFISLIDEELKSCDAIIRNLLASTLGVVQLPTSG